MSDEKSEESCGIRCFCVLKSLFEFYDFLHGKMLLKSEAEIVLGIKERFLKREENETQTKRQKESQSREMIFFIIFVEIKEKWIC